VVEREVAAGEDQQKNLPHTEKNSAFARTVFDAPVASSVTTTDMVRVEFPGDWTITEHLEKDDVQPPDGAILKPLVLQSKLYPPAERPSTWLVSRFIMSPFIV
jgi:hypothetical protein